MRRFMSFFFQLLYHPFAFTYDLVAWVVSFGKWRDWVFRIEPHLKGRRILELGHGPGHLQRFLRERGLAAVGMDESAQMGRLAKRRLGAEHKLTRGLAQALPFAADSFESVVATFPTEYIFDARTLAEVRRVLMDGGRLIVLPAAFPSNGFLKWLYKVTGESPQALDDAMQARLVLPFKQAGFSVEVSIVELRSSRLVVVVAE